MHIRTSILLAATLARLSLPLVVPPNRKLPKVPRPIPVARHGLRPARCGCAGCGVRKIRAAKRRVRRA